MSRAVHSGSGDTTILVDGHVHFYPLYDWSAGLSAAVEAFRANRPEADRIHHGSSGLVVVDPTDADGFETLHRDGVEGWSISRSGPLGLTARESAGEASLSLVGGRQIRTDDGLEVLAYFTRERFTDGLSLEATVEAVLRDDAIPVVPWSFGKWWGARGRRVAALLDSSLGSRVFIADTATRPRIMPEPKVFDAARRRGIPIIAGTDPLPFEGEERKIGRYGFSFEGTPRPGDFNSELRRQLLSDDFAPALYGIREDALSAVRVQVAMQLRRMRKSES